MFPVSRCFVQVLATIQLAVVIDPSLKRLPPWRYVRAQLSHSPHRRSSLVYVYVYNRISRRQQMAALTKVQAALRQSAGCHAIL